MASPRDFFSYGRPWCNFFFSNYITLLISNSKKMIEYYGHPILLLHLCKEWSVWTLIGITLFFLCVFFLLECIVFISENEIIGFQFSIDFQQYPFSSFLWDECYPFYVKLLLSITNFFRIFLWFFHSFAYWNSDYCVHTFDQVLILLFELFQVRP